MMSERRWLILIFSFYAVLGIGYSLLMPPWEAPDEPAHYHLAWRLARQGAYATEKLNYEANQPHAYYYLGSYVIRALDTIDTKYSDYYFPLEYKYNIRVTERRFDWNDENYRVLPGLYALRWINLFFGGLALWINWKVFKIIAPDKPTLGLSALALAGLMPQYLHIMSSVNNDAVGTLAGASLFYLAVRIASQSNAWLSIVSVPLAILLPLTTKLTVLPVSAAVLFILASNWLLRLRQKRWLIFSGIAILIGALFSYFLFPRIFPSAANEITWRLFSLRDHVWTAKYLKSISSQILSTYWGQVGWLAVGLPKWIIYSLTALGFVGILIQARNLIKANTNHPQFSLWLSTFIVASFTILAVARNALTTGGTQGRLLFPAAGALSLFMVSGWYEVLPERVQRKLPLILTVLMVILNIGLWIFGVIPIYYQPFLD